MGGRKGYSLKKIVGDKRKIISNQKDLLQGIKDKNTKKVISASAKILAKSDSSLASLAHSFTFLRDINKKDYNRLHREETKERRKELSKRWAAYRKEKGKTFDSTINRNVVDSATRVMGVKK